MLCRICGRTRKVTTNIELWGTVYDKNVLRQKGGVDQDLTEEELGGKLSEIAGEDGSTGVSVLSGPSCAKRAELYHELKHYKMSLYQDINVQYQTLAENEFEEK